MVFGHLKYEAQDCMVLTPCFWGKNIQKGKKRPPEVPDHIIGGVRLGSRTRGLKWLLGEFLLHKLEDCQKKFI